ncbi:MAG: zinc-binding dehydrogenase [Deltaproteobacteria bacterium]|nr:zinc-binding dehydrogenase [Deltaproteobacteria bacterium]
MSIPSTHKVVQLSAYDGVSLSLVEKPVPKPEGKQLLVKVLAAPINPSDVMFTRGLYGLKKPLPTVPGFEGSGVVVDAGNLIGKALIGKRVAFTHKDDADGTWAEYCLTDVTSCFPLKAGVSDEQGAMLIVNPLTAWGMCHVASQENAAAIVHTAAASALGRFLCVLAEKKGLPVIHVVRRAEQREILVKLGAKHVLDSSDVDFDKALKSLAKELKATLAFDAVAGPMTGRLVEALPRGSSVRVYGALSEQAITLNPGSLIFAGKSVRGFYLTELFHPATLPFLLKGALDVQGIVEAGFTTTVAARRPLAEAKDAVAAYMGAMTDGKVLFVP